MKAKNNQAINQEIKDINEAIDAMHDLWLKYESDRTREEHEVSQNLYQAMTDLKAALRAAEKIKEGN